MSVNKPNPGAPIAAGNPLARVLDDYAVPELSADFADKVLAAAAVRPVPLPELRRPARFGPRGWRIGQRFAIGIASFGALATAAAATGLLEQLAIPVPSAQSVWASISGNSSAAAEVKPAASPDQAEAATPSPVAAPIIGPIDTPAELNEAFRRVDQVRAGRREERRAMIDQRVKSEIERRRGAGLPVPTSEQEAKLRALIETALARREQEADQRRAVRRAGIERKIENGETLEREDVTGRPPLDPKVREQVRELGQLPVEQRHEAWRSLPVEDRRSVIEALRARRAAPIPALPAEAAPAAPVTPTPAPGP
jgi:hypothetical protein